MRPVAIVTGASAGIGTELARVFAANGHELVLVARREREMSALADEIAGTGRARPLVLPLDLAQPGAAGRIGETLAANGLAPQFIVNNAGFGLFGAATEVDLGAQLKMIDVNARALTELSLAFVDDLARNKGGILNVASVAAFVPGPGMAVYYATKAFVLSFTEALHSELGPRGVRVTALCPGPVATEFQAVAGAPSETPIALLDRSARQVAEDGYRGLMAGRRLVVSGLGNKLVTLLPRIVPRGLVLLGVRAMQMRRYGANRPLA